MLKPGTLCIIVRTAEIWRFALGHIVTITGCDTFGDSIMVYTFTPEKRIGEYVTNRGGRECFRPLDNPDVFNETRTPQEIVTQR